jgi:tetratricopeptide (TPR) repeat protein
MTPRILIFLAVVAALPTPQNPLAAPSRAAARPRSVGSAPAVSGSYDSPLGRVSLVVEDGSVTGKLVAPAAACPFAAGEEVLRATLLDDSLAGKVRVWLAGDGCAAREAWGNAVLLAGPAGLSGAVHVEAQGCSAPLGPKGGLTLVRLGARAGPAQARTGKTAEGAKGRREKARAAIRDGAAWLGEGNFEAARRQFLAALELDPKVPEALNGVGVTYRMRNDLPAALGWYKRALAVDPDFGDAYYNMACVYALQGERELALRYLQIAALNGYASAEGIDADPDLAALREEPAYKALLKAHL